LILRNGAAAVVGLAGGFVLASVWVSWPFFAHDVARGFGIGAGVVVALGLLNLLVGLVDAALRTFRR
jgi:hypothetical protein